MENTKVKNHWFLKYPLISAFVLPLCSVIGVMLLTLLIMKAMLAIFGEEIQTFVEFPSITQGMLRVILAFIIILVMKHSSGWTFQFGFYKKNLLPSLGLSAMVLFLVLDNIVESSLAGLPVHSTALGWFSAFLGGIAPGFFEEVACRGVVLSNMMERWKTKDRYILKSALASGIAFGVVHLINLTNGDFVGTILQVCYASALGIFFGGVYLRTRNLWGLVIVHSLMDISAEIFIGDSDTTALTVAVIVIITVVYTLIGLYLIRPKKQEEIKMLWTDQQAVMEADKILEEDC